MTNVNAIFAELDAARRAYEMAMMSNAHPSALEAMEPSQRLARDVAIVQITARYNKARAAYANLVAESSNDQR